MLKPSKHTEIDHTLLAVSATVLRHMRHKQIESYVAVRDLVRKQSFTNDVLFVPALNFLFALGLVDYRPKADILEYTGPK